MIHSAFTFNPIIWLIVPAAFVIGSIPFGILLTRGSGVDLTKTGSKNIGATNVLRTAGKIPALLTLVSDMLKGTLAVYLCSLMIHKLDYGAWSPELGLTIKDLWLGIAGLAAVSGHMFSVFLSFKGGKGVATGLGVMLFYSPAAAGIMFVVWILTALIFRYSSLAALVAVAALPFILFFFNSSAPKITIGALIALLIIIKHKENIQRIIAGKESRIGDKSRAGK